MNSIVRPQTIHASASAFAALTPTLLPATHTNSYALGTREVLLVEPATPYEDEQRAWLDWARGLVAQGRTLVGLLATHHHPDHIGGVDVLSRELGVPLLMHAATASRVDLALAQTAVRHVVDGETLLLAGPVSTELHVLCTPGHAPGHVCLWDASAKTLVCGDMMAGIGTILIAPGDGDMAEYLRQLARLAALGEHVALPAHGDPITDAQSRYTALIAHRLAREAKVLAAVQQLSPTGASPTDLVPVAYADTPSVMWPWAELSLCAHLEKLEREGRVHSRDGRFTAIA